MKQILCLLLFFSSIVSFAQSVTGEAELYEDYKKVDLELNAVYLKLKSRLKETDKISLIEAQKAWLNFRDLNCKFKTHSLNGSSGPIENKMKIDCLIQATTDRIKELNELIDEF